MIGGGVASDLALEIRSFAERKLEAGKTLQEIADFLTGKGLRTRSGQPWSAVALAS